MKHILLTTIAAVLLVGCGNPEADSLLFDAANKGNIEAAKQAIADGADVDAKDDRFGEWTPLHLAAREGYKEIVELLIASGAEDGRGYAFLERTSAQPCRRVKIANRRYAQEVQQSIGVYVARRAETQC